jgi:hypothetical protein
MNDGQTVDPALANAMCVYLLAALPSCADRHHDSWGNWSIYIASLSESPSLPPEPG